MTQVMNDSQLEFDLGEGEKATDVSFDRPEGDESPEAPEQETKIFQKPEQESAPKNELDEISEGVQKRISKLTARMREAERRHLLHRLPNTRLVVVGKQGDAAEPAPQ